MNRRAASLPKSPLNTQSFLRRARARFAVPAVALTAGLALFTNPGLRAANTEDDVKAGATDLGVNTTTTYNAVAGTTSDVTFAASTTYASASNFALGTALSVGSLNDLNATAITINGTAVLTLNDGAGTSNVVAPAGTNGGSALDALFVANGASLTINDSAGILLTSRNSNFDAVGTGVLNLGTTGITIVSGFALGFTGSGTISVGGVISGTTGAVTINDTGGSTTFSGANTYTGATTVTAGTFKLSGSLGATTIAVNGGTFTETGAGVIGSTATLTTTGGTTSLSGANTYSGATSVNGGTLTLDFSTATTPASAANIIKTGNTINLGGGTLAVKGGGAGDTNSQTFGTTALATNTGSFITTNVNGGTALTLALGGITRAAQSALDITFSTGTGAVTTSTMQAPLIGILVNSSNVAYATANGGTTWVSKATTPSGGPYALTPLTTYSIGTANYVTANNVDVTTGDSVTGVTVNTLRFNAANDALTLSGTNVVNTGGVLVTPTGTGSTISGGTLTAGTGGHELVLHDYGSLNVSSIIANNGTATALTLAGTGTTTLSGANTLTGTTSIVGGKLDLSNSLALQNSPLQYNTANTLVFDSSVTSNAFTLGGLNSSVNLALVNSATTPAAIGLTLNVATGGSYTYSGVLSGTGATLTKTGAGTEILSGASTYTGATAINGGVLNLTGSILNSAVTVGSAGQILFTNSSNESVFVTGGIAGAGAVNISLGNQNNDFYLNEANTYTGATILSSRSVLRPTLATVYSNGVPISGSFGVNSALTFNAGQTTVILNGLNEQVGSLVGNPGAGSGVVLNGGNLTIGGDNTNATFSGQISGNLIPGTGAGTHYNGLGTSANVGGNLVKIGTGVQTFSSPNLYVGSTIINGGTISINSIANGGVATTVTTTVAAGATTLSVANATGVAAGQNIVGSGGLQNQTVSSVSGTTVTLSTATTDQAINSGTAIYFGTGNGLGISTNAAANLVLDGGTLQYTGAVAGSTDRLFTVGSTEAGGATGTLDASGTATAGALDFINTGAVAYGTTGQARTLGLTGTNTGANTLAPSVGDNGTGAVNLTKSGIGSWTLTGNNTYTGTTMVSAGILTAAGTGTNKALGGTTSIVVNGGSTLLFGAANQLNATTPAPITVGTATVVGPPAVAATTGILSFAASASQGTAATSTGGAVSGNVTTGGTISGGPTMAGLGALTLNNTATLAFGGASTTLVFGTFTPNGNVLNVTGYTNMGTATAGNSGTGTDDRLIFSGDQSGNFGDFNFGAGAGVGVGEVALDGGFFEITAVPEPSTWTAGITCLGMMGVLLVGRRESRRGSRALV